MKTVATLTAGFLLTFATASAQPDNYFAYNDANANINKASRANVELIEGVYYDEKGLPFNGEYIVETNGVVIEKFTIQEGRENGKVSFFYPDGSIKETGNFDMGERDGKWSKWSTTGVQISEAAYKDGKKDSTWVIWDDQGNKIYEMNYDQGKKVGTWKMWDISGNLVNEKDYGF